MSHRLRHFLPLFIMGVITLCIASCGAVTSYNSTLSPGQKPIQDVFVKGAWELPQAQREFILAWYVVIRTTEGDTSFIIRQLNQIDPAKNFKLTVKSIEAYLAGRRQVGQSPIKTSQWIDNIDSVIASIRSTEGDTSAVYQELSQIDLFAPCREVVSIMENFWKQKDRETAGHTPDKLEWKERMDSIIAYNDAHFFPDRDYYYYWADVRARLTILNGLNYTEEQADTSCWNDLLGYIRINDPTKYVPPCLVYYMDWQNGFQVAVIASLDGVGKDYAPHKDQVPLTGTFKVETARKAFNETFQQHINTTAEDVKLFPAVKKDLPFRMVVTSFPERDSMYLVGVSVGFPAAEFKADSLQRASVVRTIVVYRNPDSPACSVVFDSSVTESFTATTNMDLLLHQYWSWLLPIGVCQISLSLSSVDGTKLGIKRYGFEIPPAIPSKRTSDLFLTRGKAETAPNGIPRNEKRLRGVAYNVFNDTDTLYLYVESNLSANSFKQDNRGLYEYIARAYFLGPLKREDREGQVIIYPVEVLKDQTSVSVYKKRGLSRKLKENESLVAPSSGVSDSLLVFSGWTEIPKALQKGSYLLQVQFEDLHSDYSVFSGAIVNIK
jgi:hypothetical protein